MDIARILAKRRTKGLSRGTINPCILMLGPCIRDTFEHVGLPDWREHLKMLKGQWAPFQSILDLENAGVIA